CLKESFPVSGAVEVLLCIPHVVIVLPEYGLYGGALRRVGGIGRDDLATVIPIVEVVHRNSVEPVANEWSAQLTPRLRFLYDPLRLFDGHKRPPLANERSPVDAAGVPWLGGSAPRDGTDE